MCLPANVPVTEQELPAEIALFDYIVIGDGDLTLGANTKTHHCKVLDELTTKSASTDQKHLQKGQAMTVNAHRWAMLSLVQVNIRKCSDCECASMCHAVTRAIEYKQM